MKRTYLFLISLLIIVFSSCDVLNNDNSYLHGFINGTINNWDLGGNKVIRFGNFDDRTQMFVEYGHAQISSDGSFSFDTLSVPPHYFLEPVNNGPTGEGNCSGDMVISNPDVLIGFGKFIVTEANSYEPIAGVLRTDNPEFYSHPRANTYIVDYIYSRTYVSADGTSYCENVNWGKPFYEIVYSEVFLNEGWNKVVERITYLSADSLMREVTNYDPAESRWVLLNNNQQNGQQHDFIYDGHIENWNLGSNKRIVFGGMDYAQNRFLTYAESQIDATGNFHFRLAQEPVNNSMRLPDDIFRMDSTCTMNLNISNPYVKIAPGDFIIIDNSNEQSIGYVNYGKEELDPQGKLIVLFKIRHYFSYDPFNITGNIICNWDPQTGRKLDMKLFDVSIHVGWNAIYDGFEKVENDTAYFQVNNVVPEGAKWFYHPFEAGH